MSDVSKTADDLAWVAGVGSASGLGAAVARRFAAGGFTVVITGRNAPRLAALAAELSEGGMRVQALPGDVSVPADVARLASALRELGTLRAAVFNAGNAVRGTPLELTPEACESTWRGSAFAGFLFARAAIEQLLAGGGGTLLFTGATASLRGRGPFTAFASAKAALRSLAQSCAREYGPRGVHVAHIVIDGGIDGEQLRSRAPQRAREAGADALLEPAAIAEAYWQLFVQPRSAWTQELDLRPAREPF
jgi:NAD(P)-dependent dehydrogenase (short-subunit alcohol dehydrogenase family)